jgi:hypothetical protein
LIVLCVAVGGNVLLPRLGLVVSLPGLIVLLAIVDAAVILLALFFRRLSYKNKLA